MNYPHLLQPLVVRGHIIKNRMESANSLPHFLQGPEKYPADSVITHYANRAKAGAAIVTCMGINDFNEDKHMPMDVDAPHFPDFDLYNSQCQNYLLQLADAIHFYGSIACMGFFMATNKYPVLRQENPMDPGKLECRQFDMPGEPFMDPTPEKMNEYFLACQKSIAEFSRDDMEFMAESYAQQCQILQFLGFDMATVHLCYRTQVPTKFLSPLTNQRTDEFGGSVENRARFPLMILKRIREKVGPKFLLEIQLSAEEDKYGGYTLDDTVEFLRLCEPYVDFVQLRASDADGNHPTNYEPLETPVLRQAAYIKQKGTKVLIAPVGGWHNPDTAEKALAEGKVDMVSMARAWVSNPDYGQMLYEGRADDIIPCLRCNKCHGRGPNDPFVSVCSVNPKIGIEHRLHTLVTKPGPSQKVAVIGGGPAGMKAAMDLCDRGHKVTLYEAADHLGGAIYHSDFVDFKWTLKDFKDYLIHQVSKRDIEVRLNTRATPEMISAEHYDVVIAALGAQPAIPPIPGVTADNVVTGVESMLHPDDLGQRVVVIGGGEVGTETGMNLANKGHDVTVLEMRDDLAMDATVMHFRTAMMETWRKIERFHSVCGVTVTGVSAEGVSYQDKEGVTHTIPADSVVVSTGMKPLRDEAMAFYGCAQRFFPIGDCTSPATVQQAMRSAFAAASQI
jgi:2,4-dienoyl-CoA reductase-like NADH-dependent reductase (Old Yellow Enzyme family)/thioredoxin reductase